MVFKFLSSKLRPTDEQICRVIHCLDDSYRLCQISAFRLLCSPFFEIRDFVSFCQKQNEILLLVINLTVTQCAYEICKLIHISWCVFSVIYQL